MQQFQCTKCLKIQHNSTASTQNREGHRNLQLHCARKLNRNRRQSDDARAVAQASQLFSAAEPPFAWKKKHNVFVQILTLKSHPWCSSSNAIRQQSLVKNHRIASNSSRTHPFDAPVPMHKVLPRPLPLFYLHLYLYSTSTSSLPLLYLKLMLLFSTLANANVT